MPLSITEANKLRKNTMSKTPTSPTRRSQMAGKSQVQMFDTTRQGTANSALLGGLTGVPTAPGVSPPVRTKRKTVTRKMT